MCNLNNIMYFELDDNYKTLNLTTNTAEYTFFSRKHGKFTKIDHILRHKTGLNKLQNIKIMESMFPDHNKIIYK